MPSRVPADPRSEKAEIRALLRARRTARTPEQHGETRTGLADRINEAMAALRATGQLPAAAHTIAAYLARPDEPDPIAFLTAAAKQGMRILVPSSRPDRVLDWREWHPAAPLARGAFDLPEPLGTDLGPGAIAQAELILAPAAAVSATGDRLGWGLGYYDRALELASPNTPVIALVFDDEVLPAIPTESHDKAVTAIATPARMIITRAGSSAR